MTHLSRSLDQWHMRPGRAPYLDESLYGYIAHRAAEERLPTTFVITSLADVTYMHRPELIYGEIDLTNVADCLRADAQDLAARTYPLAADDRYRMFFGSQISRFAIDYRVRWFSPTALSNAPYHRAIWSLRPLPFCAETGVFLQNACPLCQKIQRWHHANGIDRCDFCGQSLAGAVPVPVPEHLLGSLRMAAKLVHPDPTQRAEALAALPDEARALGPGQAFDLMIVLATVVDPTIRISNRTGFRSNATPSEIAPPMALAWEMLAGWPAKFEEFIAERLAARPARFGDGNRGATVRFLELADNPKCAQAISSMISTVRDRLTHNRDSVFNVTEAAKASGLRPDRILELRRAGQIKSVFHHRKRNPQPLLDKEAVVRLSERLKTAVTAQNAALQIGIPYQGVEQLIVLGALETALPIGAVSDEKVLVWRPSLQKLIEDVAANLKAPDDAEMVPLDTVLHGLPGVKPWGPVLLMLAEGRVPIFARADKGPLIKRIFIQICELETVRAATFCRADHPNFSFFPLMSKKDAMTALNLHPRKGISLLSKWPSNHGHEGTVPVEAVEQIVAKYMSPAELALKLNCRPLKAIHVAERMKIYLSSLAGFDRQAVERRLG